MKKTNIKNLNFKKMNGLVPVIIQDVNTKTVLMLGFMNEEALNKTLRDKKVTFWSRTKKRLWQKGEKSKNFLEVVSIKKDCDNDSLLILVKPAGPTCHTEQDSCFGCKNTNYTDFDLDKLYEIISNRQKELPKKSYTTYLFKSGLDKITQKIGEESTEVIIAGKNKSRQRLIEETADLFFHILVLLVKKKIPIKKINQELNKRNKIST